MAKLDSLQLAVWMAPAPGSLPLVLTRFMLPAAEQDILAGWCREKTQRADLPVSVILQGLSEILAWFVPEVAFMRHDEETVGARNRRLCLYFLGNQLGSTELVSRVQAGIAFWLNILYPGKPSEMRSRISASSGDRKNWTLLEVQTTLRSHEGVCALPADNMLFDALAAYAAAALSGKKLMFRSGASQTLVPKTAQASPYLGIELVSFPPKRGPNGDNLWSEVITVATATYPERPGVHLVARPSIRNWGPVKWAAGRSDPLRSLDVFVPGINNEPGLMTYRHTSFGFKAKRHPGAGEDSANSPPVFGYWEHQSDQRVFGLLKQLAGNPRIGEAEVAAPLLGEDGIWALPRLGSIHGDKYLPGGSGIPWPDRKDIATSLDKALAAVGFEMADPMQRVSFRMPLDTPFSVSAKQVSDAQPKRRRATLSALRAIGNSDGVLDFLVFHRLERTPSIVREQLIAQFGPPSQEDGQVLRWDDGLAVRILAKPSGPLGELLPKGEVTEAEKSGRTDSQVKAIWKVKQSEANASAQQSMAEHIAVLQGESDSICCAILEMPASMREDPWRDPFAMARRELARHGCLPQVVLVEEGQDDDNKYRMAVRDCLRMLGVLPFKEDAVNLSAAAVTVIQRNEEVLGGGTRQGHAFPLAARVRENVLECALPEESGEPCWLPYAQAALRVISGDYGKFGRNKQEENMNKFSMFFTNVFEQIDRIGEPTLLIAESETTAHKLPALQNQHLAFDRLRVGNETYTPERLPNLRIVRTSLDVKRQPHYYHETEQKTTQGLFSWGDAKRTLYAIKKTPQTVSFKSKFASQASRHGETGDGRTADHVVRPIAQLDEISVIFMQAGDEPRDLAAAAHRFRSTHAQYDDDTRQPFPLHELRLLGRGGTF